ncbi:MAG: hypothetical protein M1814_000999 [Vezdaea aestivalis]|nr:MAG: hypothetical protein M1814_000999 [Vezdaea aestivalis]
MSIAKSNEVVRVDTASTSTLRDDSSKQWESIAPIESGTTVCSDKAEKKRKSDRGPVIRDSIIGFADGLTVPFALTAGLSSLGSSKLVIIGGLAELFSGAISMGLGAYLAAITEAEHFVSEQKRERKLVLSTPEDEEERIYGTLQRYGIEKSATLPIFQTLKKDPEMWVQFVMDFDLRLEEPAGNRAWISALTMGMAYFIGGIIPMIPYFAVKNVTTALFVSIGITAFVLLVFGYTKTRLTVSSHKAAFWGALQTLMIGAVAAGASYGIVRAIDHSSPGTL